jgi:tryptophan 2,3-dioxygenase
MYYSSYLQLDKILDAQHLESDKVNQHAHDEMLFIVIHQTYELWFKQILFEAKSIHHIFSSTSINDNAPETATAVRRMNRIVEILRVLVHQIDILETMTPIDFLEFRDLLRPASGFQSVQFKELESLLGLKMEQRHGQSYYTSQLNIKDLEHIKNASANISILTLIDGWLSRMPFFDNVTIGSEGDFWKTYRSIYEGTLREEEKGNMTHFDQMFFEEKEGATLSLGARRSAMLISLYRDMPLFQNAYRIINHLLDIDELMATWRWRHMNMVHRMIGMRSGTGGSTGKGYLREAAMKHYIFSGFAELNSYMVNRTLLPELPLSLNQSLGFKG